MPKFRTLDDLSVTGKRVLVRCDLNVPMKDGKVTDATRIERSAETLKELSGKGARIIVLSHFGRPKGRRAPEFSQKPLVEPLAKALGRSVAFAEDCIGSSAEQAVKSLKDGDVLRFDPPDLVDGVEVVWSESTIVNPVAAKPIRPATVERNPAAGYFCPMARLLPLVTLVTALFVIPKHTFGQSRPRNITGTWRAQTPEGPREVVVRADSSASYGEETVRWRLMADSLYLAFGDEWVGYVIAVKGSNLTISGGDLEEPMKLKRVGPPTPLPDGVRAGGQFTPKGAIAR